MRRSLVNAVRSFALILAVVGGSTVSWAGTVAYWRFEDGDAGQAATGSGSLLDVSGHNLNGTPINGPVFSGSVPGSTVPLTGEKNLRSLSFNGTSQRVFVPDNAAFALTQSLTLEAYVNVRSVSDSWPRYILFRGDDRAGTDPYALDVYKDGNGDTFLRFFVTGTQKTIVAAPLPAYSTWVHVAGTLDDASGKMSLFIDGELANSITTSERPFGPLLSDRRPGLGIGSLQSNVNPWQYFDGLIDEVRISDTALSPSQFLNAGPVPVPLPSAAWMSGLGVGGLMLCSALRRIRRPRGH